MVPQFTLPAGVALVAEGVDHAEFDAVSPDAVTIGRAGAWSTLTSEAMLSTSIAEVSAAHARIIARNVDKATVAKIEDATPTAVSIDEAMVTVAAEAACDVRDLWIFGAPAEVAALVGNAVFSPASGPDMVSYASRYGGAPVYPTPLASSVFISPKSGKQDFGQWVFYGLGQALIGSAITVDTTRRPGGLCAGFVGCCDLRRRCFNLCRWWWRDVGPAVRYRPRRQPGTAADDQSGQQQPHAGFPMHEATLRLFVVALFDRVGEVAVAVGVGAAARLRIQCVLPVETDGLRQRGDQGHGEMRRGRINAVLLHRVYRLPGAPRVSASRSPSASTTSSIPPDAVSARSSSAIISGACGWPVRVAQAWTVKPQACALALASA